ncbi:MAG: GNVR domain-containing protein [Gammaproteobacteria bacterium]
MNEQNRTPERVSPRAETPRVEAPETFNLHELFALLYRERWLGLLVFGGVFALFILYALTATPIYRADALLQVEKQPSALSQANALLGGLFATGASTQAEVEILRSRAVLFPVVRRLGLAIAIRSPAGHHYDGLEAALEQRALVIRRWVVPRSARGKKLLLVASDRGHFRLETRKRVSILQGVVGQPVRSPTGFALWITRLRARPGQAFRIERVETEQAVTGLRSGLSAIELGVRTGIIELALEGPHPRWLDRVVNAIVDQYRLENVAAKATQARESLRFIDRQLPRLKRKLGLAETRFNRYRAQNHIVDVSAQTRAFLSEATSLEEVLTEFKLRLADLSQSYEPGFPLVRALLREERQLETQKNTLRTAIEALPLKEQQYIRLKRDVEIYTRLYMALLAKAQDLEVEKAGTVGNVRVVEHAVVPDLPVKPNRRLLAILGVFLGGGLALGAVFLKRALVHGVGNPEEIEDAFGLPLYATIPHSAKLARASRRSARTRDLPLLAKLAPDDPAVEAIRSLRVSLEFTSPQTPSPVITMGGLRPGVGKTFLAVDLGYLLANSGQRVLLIDGDLHRGMLHRYFGAGAAPGLADVLQSGRDWTSCLKPHPDESRLALLPTGSHVAHPDRLLEGADLGVLFEHARERFDVVIVDLPPYLGVTDGFFVARRATVNLLVLKAGAHPIPEIRRVLKRLEQTGVHLSGFVMNDLTRGMSVYRYYGYGYRYRRDEPPVTGSSGD